MQSAPKTQKELLQDLVILRQRVGFLEATDVAHQQANAALELQVRERTAALHEATRHLTHAITARTQQEHQQQAHLMQLAAHVVLAEEQERRRIAQGLHDQVGQLLAIATGSLDTVRAGGSGVKVKMGIERQNCVSPSKNGL